MKNFFCSRFFYGHELSSLEEISTLNRPKHKFFLFYINKPVNYHIEFRIFDCEFFFGLYDDLNTAIIDHWIHFLHYGRKTGHVKFEKNFYFDEKYYLQQYHPDIGNHTCFFEHYLKDGWKKNYNPSAFFDTEFYIKKYSSNYNSELCPFEHFLKIGFSKGNIPFAFRQYSDLNLSYSKVSTLPVFASHNEPNYIVNSITSEQIENGSFTIFLPLGLGDAVAIEPIYRYLKITYPDRKIYSILYKNQYEISKFNRNCDGIVIVDKNKDIRPILREVAGKTVIVNCVINGITIVCGQSSFLWHNSGLKYLPTTYFDKQNLLSAMSAVAGLPELDVQPIFWTSDTQNNCSISRPYIVIHCASADKKKNWGTRKYSALAYALLSKGYCVVEIGVDPIICCDHPNYHNLTSKLSFQEIYNLIKESSLFVGPDSVFLHLSNCAKQKAVCIAGPVKGFFCGHKKFFSNQLPCSGDYYIGKNIEYCYPPKRKNINSISVEDVLEKINKLID